MRKSATLPIQRGTSMIEVLVTIVILAFGLLGLVGLQTRLQVSEMEAYQRTQALILLEDMANRIASNRTAAASYVTASPLGTGMACPATVATTADRDLGEWCNGLQGAGETKTSAPTTRVGAFVGGRGCVQSLGSGEYMVTVAWQGLTPMSAPPASVSCGVNSYNGGTGSPCTGDLCRRVLTTVVRIATLT
jgi:type IV pilus assembly protein PilV